MSCILISEDAASIVIVRPSSYRPSQREPRLEIAGLGQRPHPLELDLIGSFPGFLLIMNHVWVWTYFNPSDGLSK